MAYEQSDNSRETDQRPNDYLPMSNNGFFIHVTIITHRNVDSGAQTHNRQSEIVDVGPLISVVANLVSV
jgi:hypothetical protein